MFVQIVDSHIPMTKARVRAKTLPWIDSDVRRLMKARTYYCTKAKKSLGAVPEVEKSGHMEVEEGQIGILWESISAVL